MTAPVFPYDRQFSFRGWETGEPTAPPPGDKLDIEFDAVEVATDSLAEALGKIQRDDGKLKNGSVSLDTLNADVVALLLSETGVNPRGAWVPGTTYRRLDMVSATVAVNSYICIVDHAASANFDADLAAGYWLLWTLALSATALEELRDETVIAAANAEAYKNQAQAYSNSAATSAATANSSKDAAVAAANSANNASSNAQAAANAANASAGSAATSAAQAAASAAGVSLPVGICLPYCGIVQPAGWLWAIGTAVSRATYSALFAVIGTAYGAGDGVTTFNLPDMRGNFPVGNDNWGGAANRLPAATPQGKYGGSQLQTDHQHLGTPFSGTTAPSAAGVEAVLLDSFPVPFPNVSTLGHTHSFNGTTGVSGVLAGGYLQHPPFLAFNYIVKH